MTISLADPVIEEILYQGLSDYVALTAVRAMVIEESESWYTGVGTPDPSTVRQRTLAVCHFVLTDDLMRAGLLSNRTDDPENFLKWPGTTQEIMTRIAGEWNYLIALDQFEPCWFRSTNGGLRAGESINSLQRPTTPTASAVFRQRLYSSKYPGSR